MKIKLGPHILLEEFSRLFAKKVGCNLTRLIIESFLFHKLVYFKECLIKDALPIKSHKKNDMVFKDVGRNQNRWNNKNILCEDKHALFKLTFIILKIMKVVDLTLRKLTILICKSDKLVLPRNFYVKVNTI